MSYPQGRTAILKELYRPRNAFNGPDVFVVYHFCNPVFYGLVEECATFCKVDKTSIYNAQHRKSKVQRKYYIEKMERYEAELLFPVAIICK